MKKIFVILTFTISLLAIPLYIYALKNNVSLLFLVFVLDRIISFTIGYKSKKILDTLDLNEDSKNASSFLMTLIILCIIAIICVIYVLFKYPKIFILLMLGEVIDNILRKIFKIKQPKITRE